MTPTKHGGPRKGAGRPKNPLKVKTNAYALTPAQMDKVATLARQEGVSKATIVRRAIDALPAPQEDPQ